MLMKPNFALSLSFDGLRLMHRVSGGWHLVGQVALNDADLTGALDRLRASADILEPDGISTKLLIPNDQIKYLALDTTRAIEDDVRQALHGATPYAVQDLVYDYAKGGGRTYVAAVAKETLTEAKQFAAEHGFNPVSFAAVPEPFTYVGEAFFGSVDGKSIERDEDSVIVIGEAAITIAQQGAPIEPATDTVPDVEPDAQPDIEDAFIPDVPDPVVPDPDFSDRADPVAAEPVTAPLLPDETVPDELELAPPPPLEPDLAEPIVDTLTTEPMIEAFTEGRAQSHITPDVESDPNSDPEQTAPSKTDAADTGAPMFASRLGSDRNEGRPAPARNTDPQTSATASPRAEPIFSHQLPPSLSVPTLSVPTGKSTDPMPSILAPSRTTNAEPIVPPITTKAPDSDVAPTITGDAPTVLSPDAALSAASLGIDPVPRADRGDDNDQSDAPDTADEKNSAATKTIGAPSTVSGAVSGMFASRRMACAEAKTKATKTDAPSGNTDTPNEKTRLTVFGARKKPKTKPKVVIGGKPRFLGLILTAVLLLFLLAMAAVAALSEDGFANWFGFGSTETQMASDPTAKPPSVQAPTSVSEVAAPQAADATQLAASADATDALATNLTPNLIPGGQVLPPEEATSIYASTGVWQRAPRIPQIPRTATLDTMTLAVSTRPVIRVPPSPLASASNIANDALIAAPIDPPPPSQTFDYDANGLVIATPQGAITPDGILVIAGRPPLNPPTRPGTVAPVITPQDQLAAVIPRDATPLEDTLEGVIASRPAIEPPIRPAAATPAAAPEAAEPTSGAAPLLVRDGLLVLAGSPPISPPVRPGTIAPSTIIASSVVAIDPVIPENDPPETPTSTTSPEGLDVIVGLPPILPPVSSGTVAPQENVENLTQNIAAALTTRTVQVPTADTLRPLPRPAAVLATAVAAAEIATTQAAAANTPVLGALTVAQAAAFRPRTRPADLAPVQAPVQTPDLEPTPEDAAVQPTPAAPTGLQISPEIAAAVLAANNRPNPIVNPTALAVPISGRPDPRPRNMARIVARANDARQRAATQVAAAAVASRTVTPSGPTGSSVAQAATLDNAINLREVNLIGIYGGSGDRRALVRMGNGRYVRVTVGDRLDGGSVTAISAEALNYTKRGRAITLRVAS